MIDTETQTKILKLHTDRRQNRDKTWNYHLKRNQKLEGKMTNAEAPIIQYTGHKIDRLDHNYHHKSKRIHREYIKVKTLGQ